MISILEMVVNQYILQLTMVRFRLFGIVEKMCGNASFVQTNRRHINPKRRGTERLPEQLLIPKTRDVLEDMIFQFVVNVIVILITAPPHYNRIYIIDGQDRKSVV